MDTRLRLGYDILKTRGTETGRQRRRQRVSASLPACRTEKQPLFRGADIAEIADVQRHRYRRGSQRPSGVRAASAFKLRTARRHSNTSRRVWNHSRCSSLAWSAPIRAGLRRIRRPVATAAPRTDLREGSRGPAAALATSPPPALPAAGLPLSPVRTGRHFPAGGGGRRERECAWSACIAAVPLYTAGAAPREWRR